MSITVDVRDDSIPHWLTDSSVYFPKHYRFDDYSHHPDPSIQLVDVVETWKGLSPTYARELRFWQDAFNTAIAGLVEEALVESFGKAEIPLELYTDDAEDTILRMHCHTLSLEYQNLKCNINKLIDTMILVHEASGRSHKWLDWDKNNALSNFIQLHHCFRQDEQAIQVYFTSELAHPLELRVFVRIYSKPHVFHVDRSGSDTPTAWFRAPVLDDRKAIYPVDISNIFPTPDSSLWQMAATTRFPEGVRFERLYRFHYYNPQPVYPEAKSEAVKTSKKKTSSRKIPAKLGVPSVNPIREISQGDVRVQGVSDLELEARHNHRQFYDTLQNQSIGKASILGKIYGTNTTQDQYSVNMLHATISPKPDTEFGSHGSPHSRKRRGIRSSSGAICSSPTPVRIRMARSMKPDHELLVHQFVESVRYDKIKGNPFAREKITEEEAEKVIQWAKEAVADRTNRNHNTKVEAPKRMKLRSQHHFRRAPRVPNASPMEECMSGTTDMEDSLYSFSPARLQNFSATIASPSDSDMEDETRPILKKSKKGKEPMRSTPRTWGGENRPCTDRSSDRVPYFVSPTRPLSAKMNWQKGPSPTQRLEKDLQNAVSQPLEQNIQPCTTQQIEKDLRNFALWKGGKDAERQRQRRSEDSLPHAGSSRESSKVEYGKYTVRRRGPPCCNSDDIWPHPSSFGPSADTKAKRMSNEPEDEELSSDAREQIRIMDEKAYVNKNGPVFERIWMGSPRSISTAEISTPECAAEEKEIVSSDDRSQAVASDSSSDDSVGDY